MKPDYVIQVGDLYDFFSWSRFPHSRDVMTPSEEITTGREQAEKMWKRINRASPSSKLYQLKGNHDERPIKRVYEKLPEIAELVKEKLGDLFQFENVKTHNEQAEELIIGTFVFMHGYRLKLGDHAKHNRQSTICGHTHRNGVFYFRQGGQTIWELNCGFVADPFSRAMSYSLQRKFRNYTKGVGVIDGYGPRFISL